jgi:L-lactate dehydrogenase complex protein LldE
VRVGLFVTCLGEAVIPAAAVATVQVLERLGHTVEVPQAQSCCGQMHTNSGFEADGSKLSRALIRAFDGCEVVVAPSSSCVGHMRELEPDLPFYELSEFLVKRLGLEDVGARFAHRVAYHPSCHSLRVAHVGDAPERLLRNVSGLELVPFGGERECCGFGGTFAIKNSAVSGAMLADKCDALEHTDAEFCTALDGSCLLHIGGGLSRRKSRVRTIHLAEILASQ